MQTLAAFVLALVLIIFIHEYGHYRMALFWKVRVLQFSIGFGRPLLKWTRQQPGMSTSTDFTIGAIPLGGFVKMHGHHEEIDGSLTPDAFDAQSLWARVCIVSAGPLANLLLAVMLYAGLNWAGSEQPRPILSSPPPSGGLEKLGIAGPQMKAVVRAVNPGGPADMAGLRPGDQVLQVNNQRVEDAAHLIRLIRGLQGAQQWQVLRSDGQQSLLKLTPVVMNVNGQSVPAIGASLGATAEKVWLQDGPLDGLSHALTQTWLQTRLTADAFVNMLTTSSGWKQLSGPITIANVAGQTADAGWRPYIAFLALVSLSIGLMNLLPIPLLDGGHLMYYLWEGVTGIKPSPLWLQRMQAIGLSCVLLLMFFAFLNDFLRWFI